MLSNHFTALAMMYLAGLANLVEVCSGMLDLDGNQFAESGFCERYLKIEPDATLKS